MRAGDLALLGDAAQEGARIALTYFGQAPDVFWKEGNSPVSQADLAVDGYLRDRLLSARPGYGWVSEETASEPGRDPDAPFFIVDPIDGTRSFLRGEPTWCVALAVVEAGRPTVGALSVPVMGETFLVEKSGDATLNGTPCRVSEHESGRRLRISLPDRYRQGMSKGRLDDFELVPSVPSLAYRLALVACGRLDGTIVLPRANDWDIAAADLLLEKAGGSLLTKQGERHLYKMNPRRHGVLIAAADHALDELSRLAQELEA